MCGIAGIFNKKAAACNIAVCLDKMSAVMQHRGPDDEGFVLFRENSALPCYGKDTSVESIEFQSPYMPRAYIASVEDEFYGGFLHRRLSVIDLSAAAHQPMCNDDGSIWISCNGEIYNYIELRSELVKLGVQFRSAGDVEVLLKAYEQWGIRFVDRLNGMWALTICDLREKIVLAVRDRFGVKPFYYYDDQQFFAFASEHKALLRLPLNTGMNHKAVYDYFINNTLETTEEGFFRNIRELMPSHMLIYNLESCISEIKPWYKLSYQQGQSDAANDSYEDAVRKTRDLLFNAVSIRLRSDVPLGFCLSGGIDSSSIVCMADNIRKYGQAQQTGNRLSVFTAVSEDKNSDESSWAAEVAGAAELDWYKADCNAISLFDDLETIIYHQDVPLLSSSTYAQNAVMKLAAQKGIKILLDGQGGDELFAGYVPFFVSYYLEMAAKFRAGRLFSELASLKRSPLNAGILMRSLAKIILNGLLPGEMQKNMMIKKADPLGLLHRDLKNFSGSSGGISREYSSENLNKTLYRFYTDAYLKGLLRWEDRCSMQYSVESRTPFADDINLAEYVFSLPSSYKIRNGYGKSLLRDAMKGVIPERIRLRTDKLGFSTPETLWLLQSEKRMLEIINQLSGADKDKILNIEELNKVSLPELNSNHKERHLRLMWKYCNFLIWRNKFGL